MNTYQIEIIEPKAEKLLEDLAIKDYTKTIELNPNEPDYYHNRAISYDELGEREKAEADRKKEAELSEEPY